jgi:sulfate adenylyltransferase subunit 1
VVLAVNKIDLVDYDESVFRRIAEDFAAHAAALGHRWQVLAVPLSALLGDNVVERSTRMPWYTGPTLLEYLGTVPVEPDPHEAPFRFPVQYVIRSSTDEHPDYRGYAGQVAAGAVAEGDEVVVLPAGLHTRVRRIDTPDGPVAHAVAGRSVTMVLDGDLDISRGDLIATAADPPLVTDELDATICWLSDGPLRPPARLLIKHGTRTVQAVVSLNSRFDEQTLSNVDSPDSLRLNEIGRVSIRTSEALPVDDYTTNRRTGAFLVIEPGDGSTVAAGMVGAPLAILDTEPPRACR